MNIKYYLLLYMSMLLAAGAQVMLKMGSRSYSHSKLSLSSRYCNPWVVSGLLLMFISMLLNVKGLRHVPLKNMSFILPVIYIAVPLFAWIFLEERPSGKMLVGSIIMLIGVIVFNLHL